MSSKPKLLNGIEDKAYLKTTFNYDLNRKWLSLLNRTDNEAVAFRNWVAREVKAGRNFNRDFNVDEWL